MVVRGWVNVSVKADLAARVDAFLAENQGGFSNRAEVIATAVRQFLDEQTGTEAFRAFLERTLKAVAITTPADVPALLKALLAELDARPHAPTPGKASRTESVKRQ